MLMSKCPSRSGIHADQEHERRGGMSKVKEADPGDAGGLDELPEIGVQAVDVERDSGTPGEGLAVILPSGPSRRRSSACWTRWRQSASMQSAGRAIDRRPAAVFGCASFKVTPPPRLRARQAERLPLWTLMSSHLRPRISPRRIPVNRVQARSHFRISASKLEPGPFPGRIDDSLAAERDTCSRLTIASRTEAPPMGLPRNLAGLPNPFRGRQGCRSPGSASVPSRY
jgi:hypothetical protein